MAATSAHAFGMGVNVPASMSSPFHFHSRDPRAVRFGSRSRHCPHRPFGTRCLGPHRRSGFFAGRGSVDTAPSTLGGEIGKQVGSGLKWAAIGFIAYTLISGKEPAEEPPQSDLHPPERTEPGRVYRRLQRTSTLRAQADRRPCAQCRWSKSGGVPLGNQQPQCRGLHRLRQ